MTTRSPAPSSSVAIDEKHGSSSEEVKPPMASLSEHERAIIDRQLDAPKLTVSYFALFRYANKNEKLIMVVALFASIAAGAVMPLMTVCHRLLCQSHSSNAPENLWACCIPGICAKISPGHGELCIHTNTTTCQLEALLMFSNSSYTATSLVASRASRSMQLRRTSFKNR